MYTVKTLIASSAPRLRPTAHPAFNPRRTDLQAPLLELLLPPHRRELVQLLVPVEKGYAVAGGAAGQEGRDAAKVLWVLQEAVHEDGPLLGAPVLDNLERRRRRRGGGVQHATARSVMGGRVDARRAPGNSRTLPHGQGGGCCLVGGPWQGMPAAFDALPEPRLWAYLII